MEPEVFKGRCEHTAWWVLVNPPYDILTELTTMCPAGCVVVLRPFPTNLRN